MKHLNNLDANFLHFETPETPMHVGSVHLFDLPAHYEGSFYERTKTELAQRLFLAPALHRKLAAMPFDLANPVWIDDDDVDIDYHVRQLILPRPGSVEQLEALGARLHSSLLDRSRPLWEVYVIEGLASGQVAIYFKLHHAAADGKGAMQVIAAMFDDSPHGRDLPPVAARGGSTIYQLGAAELLEAAASNFAQQYLRAWQGVPNLLKAVPTGARLLTEALRKLGETHAPAHPGAPRLFAPHTIFNSAITNQRSIGCGSIPLAEAKAVAKKLDGTLNDVVLTSCAAALRTFLQGRGALPEQELVAGVPVSLRGAADAEQNNQVTTMLVGLATHVSDVRQQFDLIRAASTEAKTRLGGFSDVLGQELPYLGAPWMMNGLSTLYGRSALPNRLPPLANVMISNLPGPRVPLYMAGARKVGYWPTSVPGHGLGLNITVLSYVDKLSIGITCCRRIMPMSGARELVQGIEAGFRALQAAAFGNEDPASKPVEAHRFAAPDKTSKVRAAPTTPGPAKRTRPAPGASKARRRAPAARKVQA